MADDTIPDSLAPPQLVRQLTGANDLGVDLPEPDEELTSKEGSKQSSRVQAGAAGGAAYNVIFGGIKDPGVVGKENQDDFFAWSNADKSLVICAVFDGHGREVGQLASQTAAQHLQELFAKPESLDALRADPKTIVADAFTSANAAITAAFAMHYERHGFEISHAKGGYLLRRGRGGGSWQCIHGGTTASIVFVIDGTRLIVANCGDSSAILTGIGSVKCLQPIESWGSSDGASIKLTGAPACLEITADHSPDSVAEFYRIRQFRPHPHDELQSELRFVYDTLTSSKLYCPAIFSVAGDGSATVNGVGKYYKNVRNEWATLVATPPHADFQDALAFTRSLGDFHLQSFGVTHEPEIQWMDLSKVESTDPFSIVLCSDGIWDNWKFEEISQFALDPERMSKVVGASEADRAATVQKVSEDLMKINLQRAHANFGSSADNMTAIMMYFIKN